ncbi:MAG: COX15/CtaA family protein [Sumerlaeia bacterium]
MSENPSAQSVDSPGPKPWNRRELAALILLRGLIVWVFLLMCAGGLVRLTGSGMSIPDWPIITYGPEHHSILPPFTDTGWQTAYDTYHREVIHKKNPGVFLTMERFQREFWTEYAHRALAKTFALGYLVLLSLTFTSRRLTRMMGSFLLASGLVLVAQAILGGLVVLSHTQPLKVAIHLTTAFLFSALLLWATLRTTRMFPAKVSKPPRVAFWAYVAVAITLAQVFSGGLMAKARAYEVAPTWPKMFDTWMPVHAMWTEGYSHPLLNLVQNEVLINFTHRWLSFVVVFLVIALIARTMTMPYSRLGRISLRALGTVLTLQMVLGVMALINLVPLPLGLLHLATGLMLFWLLVTLAFELRHSPAIAAHEANRFAARAKHSATAEATNLERTFEAHPA